MLPEYPAVLLGTLTIIHVFVMVSLLPIILRGQGCGRITHPSPGSDAEQWAFRKYLLTEDHCEQSWDPASRMMATEMTRRAGEMQICKSVLGPLQTESSSIGSQQSMDGTKSGLVPDWVNAVLLEESHSQSLQCCVWLLSHYTRGEQLQQKKLAKSKIFTTWPYTSKGQPLL